MKRIPWYQIEDALLIFFFVMKLMFGENGNGVDRAGMIK
jgi:hypothetical protein